MTPTPVLIVLFTPKSTTNLFIIGTVFTWMGRKDWKIIYPKNDWEIAKKKSGDGISKTEEKENLLSNFRGFEKSTGLVSCSLFIEKLKLWNRMMLAFMHRHRTLLETSSCPNQSIYIPNDGVVSRGTAARLTNFQHRYKRVRRAVKDLLQSPWWGEVRCAVSFGFIHTIYMLI